GRLPESLGLPNAPEHLRRKEPPQVARARLRQALDINPADRAFLERNRMARADQARRELADPRLVTHEGNAAALRVLFEIRQHRRYAAARRQRVGGGDMRLRIKTGSDDLGGL